jgi:hypothetical protein
MGSSRALAKDVMVAIAATQWKLFESIRNLQDDRAVASQALLRRVADALKNDELVTALGPVLRIEQSKAIDLLTPPITRPQPPVTPPIAPPVKPPIKPGKKVVDSGMRENLSLTEAEGEIARVRQKAQGSQVARVSVSWVIEE